MPRLLEIADYWAKVPPMHEVVAGFLGATKPSTAPSAADTSSENDDAHSHDELVQQLVAAGFSLPAGV